MSEEPSRDVDVRPIDRRYSVVNEVYVLPARRAPRLDVLRGGNTEMFGLAPLDRPYERSMWDPAGLG